MTPAVEGGAPHRLGRREGVPQMFEEKASSDPYALIDEHVKRPSGNQQQTERLERELEQLQLTVRRKIDRCFDEAEEKSLCLSRALPAALATVETLGSEASRSQAAAKRLLASLEATGAHQQEGLGTLYVLQAVKKHLEDCSKIVAELHRWHFRKAAQAELLLQSLRPNSLLEASQQRAVVEAAAVSASLRHAASLLASLPEFESRLHAAKRLEQRVLFLATILLRDSVSANSTEGFGCAVSAFESLGAQETLARELPAALRSLLQKAWKTLWLQTPAGRTEETDEEGHLLPHEESQHHPQHDHYKPSTGCVAEPEALMAYAEQWAAAVEQARLRAGFIRAAAASVGGARRQAASGVDGEVTSSGKPAASRKTQSAVSRRSSTDAHQQHSGTQQAEGHSRAKKSESLWVSLLLASMGAGADVPVEALERLLQRYHQEEHHQHQQQHQHQHQQAPDGLELAEQLLAAYDVAATLISATPAFAETEAVEHHLWERFCNSVDFLPPSLLTVYGGALTRRLSALLDAQPRQPATRKVSPAQAREKTAAEQTPRAVAQMEAETHAAVEWLLEMIPSLSGSGSNPTAAPFVLAAADAALVEALHALSPRINTFHQTVATKSQNLLLQQRERLPGSPFERVPWDPSLFTACLQLHSLMASISAKLLEVVGDSLKQHFSPVTGRPSKLSVCLKALMSRPGFFLEAPSPAAVIASQETLWKSGGTCRAEDLLPHSFGTHAALMAASQDLVVSCCCTPLELFLQSCYADAVAAAVAVNSSMAGSSNGNGYFSSRDEQAHTYTADPTPTAAITAVGEHVLSLLPLLEDATPPADVSCDGSSWVSLLLQAVAKCYSRVLLSCLQQNEHQEGSTSQAVNGSSRDSRGSTDSALERQHRARARRTQQPQQKARSLPCMLTSPGEHVVLNDLACLQRLAETLGVSEEDEFKGDSVGLLGFAYMRAEFEHFLHQPQSTDTPQTSKLSEGESAAAGSLSAAAALAAEVVRTAKGILRGGQQPQV
ncbi:hypothetical protein Esti_003419 [Eimeria stiedai]